jgi:deazaflavin-dependent oxidoreductase (nitroreductase family)
MFASTSGRVTLSPGTRRVLTRIFVRLHTFVYRLTGGRIGGRWGKAPILLLTTTGRRSCEPRTTPLLYFKYGDPFVVVATNDGASENPQWYRNLQAHPEAKIQVGSRRIEVVAAEVKGDERERLWNRLVEIYANYDRDQNRASRVLPVVILRPR